MIGKENRTFKYVNRNKHYLQSNDNGNVGEISGQNKNPEKKCIYVRTGLIRVSECSHIFQDEGKDSY